MLHTRNKFETLARSHRNEAVRDFMASLVCFVKVLFKGKLSNKTTNYCC